MIPFERSLSFNSENLLDIGSMEFKSKNGSKCGLYRYSVRVWPQLLAYTPKHFQFWRQWTTESIVSTTMSKLTDIILSTLWCTVVHCGALWYTVVHYGTLWYTMVHYTVVHYGTLWYTMVHYGTLWVREQPLNMWTAIWQSQLQQHCATITTSCHLGGV